MCPADPCYPIVAPSLALDHSDGCLTNLTAGGAQDVENFRENIKAGYLPLPTDVSFEGIVKDYYCDTTARWGTAARLPYSI